MRRTLTVLLSLIVGAVLLAACGDDDTSDATPGPASTSRTKDSGESGGAEHGDASPVASGARHIEVAGRSFAFDPEELTIEAGEDIAIVLTSEDSLHDFTVEDFDGHVAAAAGETATGGFRADEPGRYTFYCSVAGHREAGMEGVLVVEG